MVAGNPMKHIWKIVLLLAAAGLVVWVLAGRLQPEAVVAEARRGTAFNAVTGTVEVFSDLDMRLKTERHGRLIEVKANVGDVVKKGDVVAQQESRLLDLRIESLKLRLAAARERQALRSPREFDIETAEREAEAVRLSVEANQAPRSRLEQVERELEKQRVFHELDRIGQREQIALLENELAQLELERDLLTVEAAFDGEVIEQFRFAGDILGPNTNLVRVVAPGRFLELTLNEEDYFGVERDQRVTVRLASYPDRQFEGRVDLLAGAADPAEKTRKVTVRVDDDEGLLAPGLTGEALLYKDTREDAVLVPRRALLGNRVFVLVDGRVEVRRVTPGFLGLDRAEIVEGIEPGDIVVVENQSLLREGGRARAREARRW